MPYYRPHPDRHPDLSILLETPVTDRVREARRRGVRLLCPRHRYAHRANLDLVLSLVACPGRIEVARLAHAVGWDAQHLQVVLQWGIDQGDVVRISRRLYAFSPAALARFAPGQGYAPAEAPRPDDPPVADGASAEATP